MLWKQTIMNKTSVMRLNMLLEYTLRNILYSGEAILIFRLHSGMNLIPSSQFKNKFI